jgi:hypothetical protein
MSMLYSTSDLQLKVSDQMLIVLTCILLKQTGHIWRPLCHVGFLNSKVISLPARNKACVKRVHVCMDFKVSQKCPLLLHLHPGLGVFPICLFSTFHNKGKCHYLLLELPSSRHVSMLLWTYCLSLGLASFHSHHRFGHQCQDMSLAAGQLDCLTATKLNP